MIVVISVIGALLLYQLVDIESELKGIKEELKRKNNDNN